MPGVCSQVLLDCTLAEVPSLRRSKPMDVQWPSRKCVLWATASIQYIYSVYSWLLQTFLVLRFFADTFRDLSLWTCIPSGLLDWVFIRILENAIDFTDHAEQEQQVNFADWCSKHPIRFWWCGMPERLPGWNEEATLSIFWSVHSHPFLFCKDNWLSYYIIYRCGTKI